VAVRVRQDCVLVRIETASTGWALSKSTLDAIGEEAWLYLQADVHGLRGVATAHDAWPTRAGAWVRDLAELNDVEIREDVSVVTSAEPLTSVVAQLSALQIPVHGLFVASSNEVSVVIDRASVGRWT